MTASPLPDRPYRDQVQKFRDMQAYHWWRNKTPIAEVPEGAFQLPPNGEEYAWVGEVCAAGRRILGARWPAYVGCALNGSSSPKVRMQFNRDRQKMRAWLDGQLAGLT